MSETERTAPAPECATPSHFPAWCDESDCTGEHRSSIVDDYVPATGGLPKHTDRGVTFPSVGVALEWDTIDYLRPAISIHLSSNYMDAQADLHLHEARYLLDTLAKAIAILETSGVPA